MEVKERFTRQNLGSGIAVITDEETRISYLRFSRANDVALIMLLNREGLPKQSQNTDVHFEKISAGFLTGLLLLIDSETGIEYLSSTIGEGVSLSVLRTLDGKPKINENYK